MNHDIKFGPRIDFKGGFSKPALTGVRTPDRQNATALQRVSRPAERKWTK